MQEECREIAKTPGIPGVLKRGGSSAASSPDRPPEFAAGGPPTRCARKVPAAARRLEGAVGPSHCRLRSEPRGAANTSRALQEPTNAEVLASIAYLRTLDAPNRVDGREKHGHDAKPAVEPLRCSDGIPGSPDGRYPSEAPTGIPVLISKSRYKGVTRAGHNGKDATSAAVFEGRRRRHADPQGDHNIG
jgi:hypothetical protein